MGVVLPMAAPLRIMLMITPALPAVQLTTMQSLSTQLQRQHVDSGASSSQSLLT
jgi:hypothetical protein